MVSSIYGFTRDYAADFNKQSYEASIRADQRMKDLNSSSNVTVPIGQTEKKDENKGLAVEKSASSNVIHTDRITQYDVQQAQEVKKQFDMVRLERDKDYRNEQTEKVKNMLLKYGTANGLEVKDEKEAKKMAERYIENLRREHKIETTTTFIDKESFEAAQKEREAKKKELVQKYRNEGKGRREANKLADTVLGENKLLSNKRGGIDFIEKHKDLFYDEAGNFSSDKYKEVVFGFTDRNSQEGEARSAYLSLAERRRLAAEFGCDDDTISDIVKNGGGAFEKDNTEMIKIGCAIAGAAIGGAAGNMLSTETSTGGSLAQAGAGAQGAGGTAGSGAAAGVTPGSVEVDLGAAGAVVGAAIGYALAPDDPGNKEHPVYDPQQPPKPTPVQPTPVGPLQISKDEIEKDISIKVQKEVTTNMDFCPYEVKKDDLWYGIVQATYRHTDGSPLSWSEVKEVYNGLKAMHNIPKNLDYIPLKTLRLYHEVNGKTYQVNCNANVTEKYTGEYGTPTQVWNGTDPGVQTKTELKEQDYNCSIGLYFIKDTQGNIIGTYKTREERDAALRKIQEETGAELVETK